MNINKKSYQVRNLTFDFFFRLYLCHSWCHNWD